MNKKSVLALEFLNVVNSNIQRPECMKDLPPPTTTTLPTTTTSTRPTTTTLPPSTDSPDDASPTELPADSTFNDAATTNNDDHPIAIVWIVLIICLVFILIIIVLVLVFIYLIRPRFTTKVLHVTRPIDEEDDGSRTAPYIQTIPRLHVLHDPVNGPYISGVNYIKHLEEDEMGWSRHQK